MLIHAAALPPGPLPLGRLGYPLAADALRRIQGSTARVEAVGQRRELGLDLEPSVFVPPLALEFVAEALGDPVDLTPFLPKLREWLLRLSLPSWLEEVAAPLWGEPPPFALPRLPAHLSEAQVWAFDPEQAWQYLTVMPALQLARRPDLPLPVALLACTEPGPSVYERNAARYLSADFLRLNLATERLSFADLGARADSPWESWIHLVRDWAEGRRPHSQNRSAAEQDFADEMQRLKTAADEHRAVATFSLPRQVQVLDELALRGQRFAELHLATDSPAALALALESLELFAHLVDPLMPNLAAALRRPDFDYRFATRAEVGAVMVLGLQPPPEDPQENRP